MQNTIKIAVIGGTGKAGKYVVKQLLNKGYQLKLLIHQSATAYADDSRVEVIQGDVRDAATLQQLFERCHVVVSLLGQPKGEPEPIFSIAAANIIDAINAAGISRYIAVTGLSIDIPGDNKSERNKQLSVWVKATYPAIFAAKQKEYELLSLSTLNWTLLRVPVISENDDDSPVTVSLYDCLGESISATTIGSFIAAIVADDAYIRQAPFVANV